jgi:hypothetical protein
MATDFDVIFDNGGGTTLQTDDGFAHYYDDAAQAANDVKVLLDGGDTSDWDGNEEEDGCRMEYDYDDERNGGYLWHSRADVERIVKAGLLEYADQFGYNSHEFYRALGVNIEGEDE